MEPVTLEMSVEEEYPVKKLGIIWDGTDENNTFFSEVSRVQKMDAVYPVGHIFSLQGKNNLALSKSAKITGINPHSGGITLKVAPYKK